MAVSVSNRTLEAAIRGCARTASALIATAGSMERSKAQRSPRGTQERSGESTDALPPAALNTWEDEGGRTAPSAMAPLDAHQTGETQEQ